MHQAYIVCDKMYSKKCKGINNGTCKQHKYAKMLVDKQHSQKITKIYASKKRTQRLVKHYVKHNQDYICKIKEWHILNGNVKEEALNEAIKALTEKQQQAVQNCFKHGK